MSFFRQRNVDGHLVTVKVGIVGLTYQWVKTKGLTINQDRFEGLDTQTVEGRCAVKKYWVFLDNIFKNIPNTFITTFNHTFSGFHVTCVFTRNDFTHHKWFEKFDGHQTWHTTLVHFKCWTNGDNGTSREVNTFTKQVLTETTLFTFKHVAQRFKWTTTWSSDWTTTGWQTINGNKYFFQDDGNMVVHRFFNNYYFYNDGTIARNKRLNIPTHYITREFPNIYEFDNDGVGKFISSDFKDLRQKTAYFVQDKNGYWRYYNEYGFPVVGPATIDGYDMYFHLGTHRQAKGELVDIDGRVYYFDKDNGRKVKDTTFDFDGKTYVADQSGVLSIKSQSTERNRYISDSEGNWYYVNDKGYLLLGAHTIDNVNVYFGTNGVQYKGHFAPDNHYYDKDNGALVTDRLVEDGGKEFYVDEKGKKFHGTKYLDGIQYYFRYGEKVKGEFNYPYRGDHYYDKETGALVTGKYFEHKNNWYYANSKGNILTGRRVIDGKHVYFYDDDYGQYKGIQAKDKLIILGGKTYYYLPGSGNRADNVTLTINHVTYYFDNDGVGHILR